ncbi:putative pentatricopeptide repeat-containing protein [Acorus gramineus]|uniref:Pentatricopeptide repeat-containing protein n=1 Tax=Acorus gramineus TaxID=55184 RepID=A0AAV9ACS3_ACOGR|nr:putative pentatricopeptide repeat-containing protein [Acorus gramineus]
MLLPSLSLNNSLKVSRFARPSTLAGLVCSLRFAHSTESKNFDSPLSKDCVRRIVEEGRWDDPRISTLSPVRVSWHLREFRSDPRLAFKLFNGVSRREGFRHTCESYCVAAHILFRGRMFFQATQVLKEMVCSKPGSAGSEGFFECLWSTRGVSDSGPGVFDALFGVLTDLGMLDEANNCFSRLREFGYLPKLRSCNNLLQRLSRLTRKDAPKKFFGDMVEAGMPLTVFTYNIMIDFYCKDGDLKSARVLFSRMTVEGCSPDIITYNTLIDGHGKLGEAMVKGGVVANQLIYTALVHGHFRNHKTERVMDLIKEMKEKGHKPDLSFYGTIIWGLCNLGKLEEAELLLTEIRMSGLKPNHVIYTTFMDAYFKAGKASEALCLLHEMLDLGEIPSVVTYCTLIDGLCKSGSVQEATLHFNKMKDVGLQPNVLAYTALIDGLCKNCCLEEATRLFNEMIGKGMRLDKVAYTSLMDGNMKNGDLQEALSLRSRMVENGIDMDLHAYSTLICGLCRFDQVERAREMLMEMIDNRISPTEGIYITLISKYHEIGKVEEALVLQNDMRSRGIVSSIGGDTVSSSQT